MKRIDVLLSVIGVSVLLSFPCMAHDPLTHQANSLGTARSVQWGLCCDGKDYIVPADWEPVEGGYRVLINKVWLPVPKEAEVTNMKNPDLEAKVWLLQGEGEVYVRCFMRGGQT